MSKYRVSAQLYTVRDFLKTPEDMKATFKRIKKIGYDYAQISGLGPIEPAALRALMLDAGVTPIGAHIGLDEFRTNLAKVVADCKAWGIKYVAIPWLNVGDYTTPEAWKKLFKEFDGYAKALKKEGIVVQYHNHAFEFEKLGVKNGVGGKTILDMMYDSTKYLQAELDFGWVKWGGGCPVGWAAKMAGRLDQVHLKDWGIKDNGLIFRELGEGCVNWPAVVKACKAAGTKDFIVEQDSCPMTNDPFLSLAMSRKYLKKVIGL